MITAQTDNFSTSQGLTQVVNVADLLANDSGGTGPLTVVSVSSVNILGQYEFEHGQPRVSAQMRSDGTILFTPDPRFEGDAKFSYTVSDGTTSSTGELHLQVMAGLGSRTGVLNASQYYRTFDGSAKAHDSSDRIIYDEHTHKLYYDADGTGSVEAVLIATFDAPALVMVNNKFEII